ncbi:MAG: DUF3786 domain-containing protein [Candidatus Omnitrophota bacterium]
MGYQDSLRKAWDTLSPSRKDSGCRIKFLNNEYEVNLAKKTIISLSNAVKVKDYYKILILHYLASEEKVGQIQRGDWVSFKQMEAGEIYFPAFYKRAIEPILKKYGDNPPLIFKRINSFGATKIDMGTAALSIPVFPKVNIGIVLWEGDDQFDAGCNILFNHNTKIIFPTEDVAVLGGIVASLI